MVTRLAGLAVVVVLVVACGVDRSTASASTPTTTTTTTIPTLPTRATTPTMVYGVIPNAQWVACGRAWLWVNAPSLEKPRSISAYEDRMVRARLEEPFVAVGLALEKAFLADDKHPRNVIYSIVTRPPFYPREVRAWTNVARACRALVLSVTEHR